MTEEQTKHFFNNVMMALGHHGWKMDLRSGHDSYCWIKTKTIQIGSDYDGDIRQIILHEIAHIDTARFCNQKHNFSFWNRMEYLCQKFLKQPIDEHQVSHKRWASQGFYSVVYL
jgi:hypothetical protein